MLPFTQASNLTEEGYYEEDVRGLELLDEEEQGLGRSLSAAAPSRPSLPNATTTAKFEALSTPLPLTLQASDSSPLPASPTRPQDVQKKSTSSSGLAGMNINRDSAQQQHQNYTHQENNFSQSHVDGTLDSTKLYSHSAFSLKIVEADYAMLRPIEYLDHCYTLFHNQPIFRVPVVRLFGLTPAGQRACLHVHKSFPYIYVEVDEDSVDTLRAIETVRLYKIWRRRMFIRQDKRNNNISVSAEKEWKHHPSLNSPTARQNSTNVDTDPWMHPASMHQLLQEADALAVMRYAAKIGRALERALNLSTNVDALKKMNPRLTGDVFSTVLKRARAVENSRSHPRDLSWRGHDESAPASDVLTSRATSSSARQRTVIDNFDGMKNPIVRDLASLASQSSSDTAGEVGREPDSLLGTKRCRESDELSPTRPAVRTSDLVTRLLKEELAKAENPIASDPSRHANGLKEVFWRDREFIFDVRVVKARVFFGFHRAPRRFVRISLLDPQHVKTSAALFSTGAVLGIPMQPYESNTPYLLHFFIDHNIRGMEFVHVKSVSFRRPLPTRAPCVGDWVCAAMGCIVDTHKSKHRCGYAGADEGCLRSSGNQSEVKDGLQYSQSSASSSSTISLESLQTRVFLERNTPLHQVSSRLARRTTWCELEADAAAEVINSGLCSVHFW